MVGGTPGGVDGATGGGAASIGGRGSPRLIAAPAESTLGP
jgi:hypothetical protein